MADRIVIYRLTGTDVRQVEEFAVEAHTEITIRRDPDEAILFDDANLGGADPGHCRIRITGEPLRLLLSDGGGATLINGSEVENEVEVLPGDEIELGPGGPKFVFDWAPGSGRRSPRRVRLPSADAAARNALVSVGAETALSVPQPAEQPVGRSLIVRPPSPPPRSRRRGVVYGSITALILAVVAVGTAYQMQAPVTPVQHAVQPALPSPADPPTTVGGIATGDQPAAEAPASRPAAAAALPLEPPRNAANSERKPDLTGTVRKIAGASRFQIQDRWIELYGVDDPTTKGEHNQAVYEYLKPFSGVIECYGRAYGRFECFGGGQNLAVIAIRRGFVQLTSDAPSEYYALVRRMAAER